MGKLCKQAAEEDNQEDVFVYGAAEVAQNGDGWCLYNSMGCALLEEPAVLNEELMSFIENNSHIEFNGTALSVWLAADSGLTPQAYARKHRRPGAWGGGIEMAVCAHVKQRKVRVWERCDGGHRLLASFGEGDDNTAINLVYVSTMHFDFLSLNGATEVRKCGAKSDERDTASKKEGVSTKGLSRNSFTLLFDDSEEEEEEEEEEEDIGDESNDASTSEDSSSANEDDDENESNSRSSDSGADNTSDSKKRQRQTEKKKEKRKRKRRKKKKDKKKRSSKDGEMNIEVSDRSDEDGDEGDEKKKATARESKRRRRERHREKKKRLAALKPLSRSAVREVVTSWLKDKNLTCTEKRRGIKVWLEENIDLALLTYEELIETKKELELLKSKSRLYEHASRLLRAETPDRESDLLNLRAETITVTTVPLRHVIFRDLRVMLKNMQQNSRLAFRYI
jgi:hypothetical protein